MAQVCIIGWDGATFDLIQPWIEQGKLPNLAKVMERGSHGPMQSSLPPWSFQAWTSFMTGKNPGKHGIYDFFRTPVGTYDLEFVNADHRRGGATLWQVLSEAGRQVVSIAIPGTFPPDPVNGIMISGFDFPGEGPGSHVDQHGMYPPQLFDELRSHVGLFPIDAPILGPMKRGEYDVALEKVLETVRSQADAAMYLIQAKPWDCFMMVFGETDSASHYFWQFCDPNSPFFTRHSAGLLDAMLRVYQEVDRQTGRLLEQVPADTNVFIISDHGSGGVGDWVLFPNLWLQEQGHIRLRGTANRRWSRLRQTFKHWAIRALPTRLQRFLYRNAIHTLGRFEARVRYGIIDWANTEAYFDENPYFPVLRINVKGRQPRGIVEPHHYEDLRSRLIERLEGWRHPETGEPIIEKAYRREEVYSGSCLEEAADIIPKWAIHQGYNFGFRVSSQSPDQKWIARVDGQNPQHPLYPKKFSSHRDEAILVGCGPDIGCGTAIADARIIDLAPTILSLLDVPVPTDMDGRILEELFRDDTIESSTANRRLTTSANGNGRRADIATPISVIV